MVKLIILLISAAFAVYLVVKGLDWKDMKWLERLWAGIGVFCMCIVGYYSLVEQDEQNRQSDIKKTFDEIVTASSDTAKISIMVKGTAVGIDPEINNGVFGENFKVTKANGKLAVRTVIRDVDNTVIATIDGDYWKMWKGGYDYNNDATGFEIVTPERQVIFQIDLLGNKAYFSGLIFRNDTAAYYWYNHPTFPDASVFYHKPGVTNLPKDKIQPIFQYPRDRFIHRRVSTY